LRTAVRLKCAARVAALKSGMTFVIFDVTRTRITLPQWGNPSLLRCGNAVLMLAFAMAQPVLAQEGPPDNARRVTEKAVPVYPELARRLNLEGVVKLRVTVAPDGAVKQSEVVGGNPVLAKAAQDAVRKWRWATAAQETKEEVQLNFHPK